MQLRVQDKLLKLFECFMEREKRDLDIKNTPKRLFEESGIERCILLFHCVFKKKTARKNGYFLCDLEPLQFWKATH